MPRHTTPDHARLDRVVAEARRLSAEREATYRERALTLFPWICGRCGREVSAAPGRCGRRGAPAQRRARSDLSRTGAQIVSVDLRAMRPRVLRRAPARTD